MTETKSVRLLALEAYQLGQKPGIHIDNVLESFLKTTHLSHDDKALFTELVNGTFRWKGYLDWNLRKRPLPVGI